MRYILLTLGLPAFVSVWSGRDFPTDKRRLTKKIKCTIRPAWSTLDHVSTPCNFCCCCGFPLGWIVSGLFSPSICPLELNNGVCMVDNGVRITKGGDGGGVVQCGAMELWSYGGGGGGGGGGAELCVIQPGRPWSPLACRRHTAGRAWPPPRPPGRVMVMFRLSNICNTSLG